MTKHIPATGQKRLELFRGFKRRIRVRLFPLARIDGSRSAKAIESLMRSGKTQDHSERTIGNTCLAIERPKPNLNQGAGLDVSPAVRDYLGLKQTDVTDWRFVDFSEVPRGPWSTLGENNTFVINSRKKGVKVTERLRRNEVGVITR